MAADSFVISVLPGSWREEETPIAGLVLDAFDALPQERKHLLWVAGEDCAAIRERTTGRANVSVKSYDPAIDRIMVASDVAITKANRKTHHELNSLGVPSISLSDGENPIDDLRVRQFPGNEALSRAATPPELAAAILRADVRSGLTKKYRASAFDCARLILS